VTRFAIISIMLSLLAGCDEAPACKEAVVAHFPCPHRDHRPKLVVLGKHAEIYCECPVRP